MEVILIDDVKNLGFEGEVLEVADGYARNFLFPREMAVRATDSNKKVFQKKQEDIEEKRKLMEEEAQDRADALETLKLTIRKAANEEGNLYGSLNASDVVDELFAMEFPEIKARQIIIPEPIREVGEYTIRVNMVGNIEAEVDIEIVPE
ncbi:MAG: 50S ribosomal protein L9 [bacterium]